MWVFPIVVLHSPEKHAAMQDPLYASEQENWTNTVFKIDVCIHISWWEKKEYATTLSQIVTVQLLHVLMNVFLLDT